MAIQTIVTCDVHDDGITEGSPVLIGALGENYEVDLCDAHRDELLATLEPYLAGARTAQAQRTRRGSGASAGSSPRRRARTDTSAIRAWAREQGYELSDRGRVPTNIMAEYEQASASNGRRRRKK